MTTKLDIGHVTAMLWLRPNHPTGVDPNIPIHTKVPFNQFEIQTLNFKQDILTFTRGHE